MAPSFIDTTVPWNVDATGSYFQYTTLHIESSHIQIIIAVAPFHSTGSMSRTNLCRITSQMSLIISRLTST